MPYAILRAAKLKTFGAIGGSLAHTYRERPTPNADPSRSMHNEHQHADAAAAADAIRARIPASYRKNAVLAIEYFVGASPEFFTDGEDGQRYFQDALSWLRERHGTENVVVASVHRDETSPHLIAYVVPLDQAGKLNCRQFLGGAATLSKMQTDFAEKVGKPYGLARGIEGSKATHTSIKKYYGALKTAEIGHAKVTPDVLGRQVKKRGILGTKIGQKLESIEEMASRVNDELRRGYEPALTLASTASLQAQRAREMALTAHGAIEEAEALRSRLQTLEGALRGLSRDQLSALFEQAKAWRIENEKKVQKASPSGEWQKRGKERTR